jgi:hypothetical protein
VVPEPPRERRLKNWTTIVFLLGFVFTLVYWARSQVAGDQLNMLSRGWLLIAEGEWIPYGLVTSAGGKAPGGLTSVLVGLPLALWRHHRAPTVILVLLQLIGYLVLDRMLSRELGPRARLLFAVVYWLNPWRLYHSGFLWNSSYLMPLGALHFWTLYRQRRRASFWDSLFLVMLMGLAAQLHAAAGVLVIVSGLLWWRGYFRLHWPGAILGALVILASLVPWALIAAADGQLLPSGESSHDRLAQSTLSVARGLGYWLRYAAMIGSSTILCLDFQASPRWPAGDTLRQAIQIVVGLATLPLVVWANVALWRPSPAWWRRASAEADFRSWLTGAVRWTFLGVLVACMLTPTAVMSWQLLSVFHLAVMPLVLFGLGLIDAGRWPMARRGAGVYAAIALILIVAIGFGSPMYRCGGDTCGAMNATPPPLRSDHEMLAALGIQESCRYPVDVPGGWWPDVLPEN